MTIWRCLGIFTMGTKNFQEAWLLKIGCAESHDLKSSWISSRLTKTSLYDIVTGYETWIHHWDPESKQESMQCRHASSSPPRKFKTQPSTGKIMATIFWDSKGVLVIDYLPDKTTMNGQYYANLLLKLCQAIKDKRCTMLMRGVWLLLDKSTSLRFPSKLFATVASYS